jgi:hypothetical protein
MPWIVGLVALAIILFLCLLAGNEGVHGLFAGQHVPSAAVGAPAENSQGR